MKALAMGLIVLVVAILAITFLFYNLDVFVGDFQLFSRREGGREVVEEEEFFDENISAYADEIQFSRVRPGGNFVGDRPGEISIENNSSADLPINTTGWQIKARVGSFVIPQAVEFYSPSGPQVSEDIQMLAGDVLYIYTNPSPIGKNIMINKCLGYLENTISFEPTLPLLCPRFAPSEIRHLSGICQDYILSLRKCELPEDNLPLYNDFACAQKLRQINYRGCVEEHEEDFDFFNGEWWIWGSGPVLDPDHDVVQLLDASGKLVDEYDY